MNRDWAEDLEHDWMGDAYRRPISQQQLREKAIQALSPPPDQDADMGTWLRYHLKRVSYKPGWAWRINYTVQLDQYEVWIRVSDPNRTYYRLAGGRRIPVPPANMFGFGTAAEMEIVEMRSALQPGQTPADARVLSRVVYPAWIKMEDPDELLRWLLRQFIDVENAIAEKWLRYGGRLVGGRR